MTRRPRRSIWPDRPLTAVEVGMVLISVAIVVLGCTAVSVASLFMPTPG